MAEQSSLLEGASTEPSNKQTIIFMVVLSIICATILAILATVLEQPKVIAKDLDRSKQMMIAARLLDHRGYFLIQNDQGKNQPAKLENGRLVPGSEKDIATQEQLLEVYKSRLVPLLLNPENQLVTFKEAKINEEEYLTLYKKSGYYKQPHKLIYKILAQPLQDGNAIDAQAIGYVIPINGFGLWDAIYGYLAIKNDGDTVIGATWYDQKETPGLGANIAEEDWQSLFPNKKIFQPAPDGNTDFKSAPIGITVVKGKVREVLGNSPKAQSAVDGMAGATLTGNGVTLAYKDVLQAYRPFLIYLATTQSSR